MRGMRMHRMLPALLALVLATTAAPARADEGAAAATAAQQPGFPSLRAPVSSTEIETPRTPGTLGFGSLDLLGRLRVNTAPVGITLAYCSGSSWIVTLTGSAQLVAAAATAAAPRHRLVVFGSATSLRIDLGFDATVTQGGGVPVYAGGGGYDWSGSAVPQNAIWLNGASGQTVFCAQG